MEEELRPIVEENIKQPQAERPRRSVSVYFLLIWFVLSLLGLNLVGQPALDREFAAIFGDMVTCGELDCLSLSDPVDTSTTLLEDFIILFSILGGIIPPGIGFRRGLGGMGKSKKWLVYGVLVAWYFLLGSLALAYINLRFG